jgi:hypothetical protein
MSIEPDFTSEAILDGVFPRLAPDVLVRPELTGLMAARAGCSRSTAPRTTRYEAATREEPAPTDSTAPPLSTVDERHR